jgi:hypothetical protein
MWLYYILISYIFVFAFFVYGGLGNLSFSDRAEGFGQKKTLQLDKIYLLATFGILWFMAAFRSEAVGNDTQTYRDLYTAVAQSPDISEFYPRYERGFVQLCKLLSTLASNPQTIIIVSSLITFAGFALFIYSYSRVVWLSVAMFFCLRYFQFCLANVRQGIAVVITILAYNQLKKGRSFPFLLLVLVATLFHTSALAFLLAWPIVRFRVRYSTAVVLAIGFGLIYLYSDVFSSEVLGLFPVYKSYLSSDYVGDVRTASLVNFFIQTAILVSCLVLARRMQKRRGMSTVEDEREWREMNLMLMIGMVFNLISFNFRVLERIGMYFNYFSLVHLPNLISQNSRRFKLLFIFAMLLFMIAHSLTVEIFRPNWVRIFPYEFIWDQG